MALTPQQLHDLIDGDPVAKAFVDAGDDVSCAARCSVIAPPVRRKFMITKRQLHLSFGMERGVAILGALRAAATGEGPYVAVCAEVLDLLTPRGGSAEDDGLDVGAEAADTLFPLLVGLGICTEPEAATLAALGWQSQIIDFNDVSDAWTSHRVMFRVESQES